MALSGRHAGWLMTCTLVGSVAGLPARCLAPPAPSAAFDAAAQILMLGTAFTTTTTAPTLANPPPSPWA